MWLILGKTYLMSTFSLGFLFGFGCDMNLNSNPTALLHPAVFLEAIGKGIRGAMIMPFIPIMSAFEPRFVSMKEF